MLSDRPPISVHLLPSLIPPGALLGGLAVVIDVLRATTVMVHALAAGCEAVIPCGEIEEAHRVANSLPLGAAILAGERGGVPIEGFDLGNSPAAFTPEVCRDKTLVMTTTNGTRAILASLDADRVVVASFVNLRATVELLSVNLLKAHALPVHLVCAGTEGSISFEDALLAGAIVAELGTVGRLPPLPDEALMVAEMWHGTKATTILPAALTRGQGGRNVIRLGFQDDIKDAARVDLFDIVGELHRDPLRIVAVKP